MAAVDEDPSVTIRSTEAEAISNLQIVLELCAAEQLRCGPTTRRPTTATISRLAGLLVAGDFYPNDAIAAYAWPLLIQAAGLADLGGGRLQLTARGRKALAAAPEVTIRGLWKRWITHGVIDELSRVDAIKGQRAASTLTASKGRRQAIDAALATVEAGTWISTDDLFRTLKRGDLAIARNDRSIWKLYLGDPQYGSLGYEGYHDWTLLEGRYTLAVLFEYAATLGMIDVAYVDPAGARPDYLRNWGGDDLAYLSRYDGLTAIRINPLGAYVLDLAPYATKAAAPPEKSIKVLPNHDIVVLGELPTVDQRTLSAFADQTGDRVWQLSAASLLAGVAGGRRTEELLSLLKRASATAVPATVRRLIAETTDRSAALTDRGMVRLVECADAATATLIARDRRTGALCELIGERHLAVPAEHEPAFRTALAALGHTLPPRARARRA